ncbi:MAG: DUF4403 family protein [Gemmatimonadetes bacterium]|nr:DUF4403 family protein [Gemmatimonadota bacterium]
MRRFSAVLALGLGSILAGCETGDRVLAPPPERLFDADEGPPPALPRTVVNVPMLLDLSAAVALMESALPARFGDIDRRMPVPGNKRGHFAYELTREPFAVTVRADTFLIGSTIHYRGRGWYDPPIGPEVGGSCGTKGQMPRARIVVAIRPALDSAWNLSARPVLRFLGPLTKTERDQCEVSFLKLDVTSKVLGAARGAIRQQLPRIAVRLASIDVRREFDKVWREILQPIRLADSVWLLLDPKGVRLGRVSGTNAMVGTTVGIDAQPRIVAGTRPPTPATPLPPLAPAGDDAGLNLLVEGRFDYGLIDAALSRAVVGREIKAPGGILRIEEIGAFGVGKGRLALGVRFGGTARGQIYFIGTPRYDTATGRITVPDLDYDATTTSLLVKGLAWLKAADIRDYLRARATFPSADALERLTDLAAKGMNRELAPGVSISAAINRTDVLRILPRPDALVVQAKASGQAALHISDVFFRHLGPGRDPAPNESDTIGSGEARRTPTPSR